MDRGTTEDLLLAKERAMLDRWSNGDPSPWPEAAATDVTYFDDIGAQGRIDGIEALREYMSALVGQIPPHTYEIVEPKVQLYGEVGIVTLRYHPTQPNGEPGPPWKATSVYRQINGDWRIVHAHWSMTKT